MGSFLKKPVKDILFVTVGYTLGGSENMISRIAPSLKMRGYKIRVLAFKGWGHISQKLKDDGIECIALKGKGKFDFRVLWRYFLYLRKSPPDLIIAFLYRAYIPTRIFGFLLGISNISSVRDVQQWMNWFHVLFERFTANFSDLIYSCSNDVTRFLTQDIGIKKEKIVTIQNGIDVESFSITINRRQKLQELGLSSKLKIVGTVCRLHEPKKGLKILLEAAKEIQKETAFQLLIIGTGKDEKKLRKMAQKAEINVSFLGERNDINEILKVMDIFVLASLYEGFPVVVLEAMATGLPIVASKVGGLKEAVSDGKTGFLVEPGDPNDLAEKIKNLLLNKKRRKKFGEAGLKRVQENFSLEKTVDGIERLWKDDLR
jgi:glycosyltransferase involved in cell wall biosynthesis